MKKDSRKYYFILNPFSSNGSKASKNLNQLLEKTNLDYEIMETTEYYHIKDIVPKIQPHLHKKDILVAVGGDGTISCLVQSVQELGVSNPVGLIPAGSGNDFAKYHGIPTDFKKAIDYLCQIEHASVHDVLVKRTDHITYITNSIGVGIDGRVIHHIHEKRETKTPKSSSYLIDAIKSLTTQKPFAAELVVDGKPLTVPHTVMVLSMIHGYFGGGVHIHPEAKSNDGYMDIIFSHRLRLIDLPKLLYQIVVKHDHLTHKKIYAIKAKEVSIKTDSNEYWQEDGEDCGIYNDTIHLSLTKQDYWI